MKYTFVSFTSVFSGFCFAFILTGSIPLDKHICELSDSGQPVVIADPEGSQVEWLISEKLFLIDTFVEDL